MDPVAPSPDPWLVDLVVVAGRSHTAGERRAISRDGERGLFQRIGAGRWVPRAEFEALPPEGRHIVTLRALAAASPNPVVFSHWSAAVVHGLPVLRPRLIRSHATVPTDAQRHHVGVTEHLFTLKDREVTRVNGLLVTSLGRTVVDLAGAAVLEEGVLAADAALAAGVPRTVLETAVDLVGPRRAFRRTAEAIAFAHPGAETPAESRTRVSAYRIGVEVPELQHRLRLDSGRLAFLDIWFPRARAALEVDGIGKYLELATAGAAAAVIDEKWREDEVRLLVDGFARVGWHQSGRSALLRPVLERIGVHPLASPPPFAEWCAAAALAQPRRPSLRLG